MTRSPATDADGGAVDRLAEATAVISNKWHPAIVHVLAAEGPARFNELKGRLGSISAKVLSDSLEDLGDSGVVERRVLTESPLRVEYDLTARGEDLEPVVAELLDWSREHLAEDPPAVLVADDDKRVARMHADWLDDGRTVETVTTADAALSAAEEADVAVLDRGLAGSDAAFFGRVRDRGAGVVALSSTEPGLDAVDLGCDAYLTKPAGPDELAAVVDRVLGLVGREDAVREYCSLEARRRAIEAATSPRQREGAEAFGRLTDRIDALADRVDDDAVPDIPVTDGGRE